MRIIAGRNRGRKLEAPPQENKRGAATRPTADRVRQALFDMLWHAPWAGRARIEGAEVLDAFAGTGALGLEALSRGAAHACFIERDRVALGVLRANIIACREEERARILPGDATRPPRAPAPCELVFLDPPYAQDLVPRAVAALAHAGWIAPGALICAEIGAGEGLELPGAELLAERAHGAARLLCLRAGRDAAA
ncbi:16S rRNA (guanine(966)-N(2))-methyltransferase RsmD [Teichococcus oryzae]|uniref:16S rRNA (Guanine(966)-N(2))-methyltransferase RsmD n=1 Tax=Teichococcus oryzae TaxID=1608942 RepID=A0A5B2TGR2_9PROT|nr:16S rRNA (guanine(966)-N(2))-methyltransferase RsmD [Pseudoroseomonas oryzae]KAA2213667.1 16S rRNA (guanine(966)-N(2))-methyltransferase RsmD [Pseudoroseomonas oryzae]